ncbi:hypothetical protein [Desulfovirgula thermocuniculi]|uniref:hypothetical protein n=1 Tax=Desulfovirgula thermocuniculi TaxID=348842 RepID=UPI000480CEFC|nr:hypothetical protein [Desulfovirgula thermocuniculi]
MAKPRTYETATHRYVPAGKDVWGQQVYAAYLKLPGGEVFAGYRYRRTREDFARLRKVYGPHTPLARWEECPEWCIDRSNTKA